MRLILFILSAVALYAAYLNFRGRGRDLGFWG
jgi:hypothetical protein